MGDAEFFSFIRARSKGLQQRRTRPKGNSGYAEGCDRRNYAVTVTERESHPVAPSGITPCT